MNDRAPERPIYINTWSKRIESNKMTSSSSAKKPKNTEGGGSYAEIEPSATATSADLSESCGNDVEKATRVAFQREDTEVEQIAERIEKRRAERVRITFKARVRFLKTCRLLSKEKGYDEPKLSLQDLLAFRLRLLDEIGANKDYNDFVHNVLRIKSDQQSLLDILDRAIELLETDEIDTGDWLYYKDFTYDYTTIISRWPFMRHPLAFAAILVFLYYLFTPVLFCVVMPSSNICDTAADGNYQGWVNALYFASTTISTVGYGDLTVDQDPKYRSFVGSMYMLASMVVLVVAFNAIASSAFSPLEGFFETLFHRFIPGQEKDLFLYQRVRKVRFVRIAELGVEIFAFILLGVFTSKLICYYEGDPEEGTDWSWMTCFYWAVQTTTTIGYGDLAQPTSLRYFKIFYLMISTALVGNALGKLGALREELHEARARHAWDSRPITKRMIDEMQAYVHDDKVDQYEFLVSSLVNLGKLSSDDIKPIMDKFRVHAGDKGYIAVNDVIEEGEDGMNTENAAEADVIEMTA